MKKTTNSKKLFFTNSHFKKTFFVAVVLLLQALLVSEAVFAQNKTVKGRVVDEAGKPVQKATVLIKGTTTGTSTDANGDFQIAVSANGTVIISAVDFTPQEIKAGNRTSLNVTLVSSNKNLTEVVVVGYGTQRKKDVTGAIVSISEAILKEVPQPNIVSQLQGRIAGLDIVSNNSRPGTSGQIRLRGNRTIARNQSEDDAFNSPLIILDGIPFGGGINDINTDDVQSVDVLKDASATAIYGSRGSNGVLIITTKRGRSGKPVITYNAYYGITSTTGKYKVFNGTEYAAFKEEARLGNIVNPGTSNYPLTTAEAAGLTNGTSTDWQNLIYKHSYSTNHELNMSGGSENGQYSLGAGYYKATAVVPGQSLERFSLRSTIDGKVNNRIKVGFNTMNSVIYTNGAGLNPIRSLVALSPLLAPYNADGSLNLYPAIGTSDPTTVNPLTINNKEAIVNRSRRLSTLNSLYGEVEIIKNLKYRINVGLNYRQDQGDNYTGPNTLYNAGTSSPPTPGTTSASNLSNSNAEAWSYVVENILTYERTFKQKHRVGFTGLYSVQKDHFQSSGFSALGVPADYIQDYNFNLAAGNLAAAGGNFSESGLSSLMGRINYAYNDRYLLTATVRRDGSSRLSKDNQWFTYPAVGVGWNAMNEKFMSKVPVLSNLKLRLGWGITASQGIQPYQTLGTLATNQYNYGTGQNITGYFINFLANHKMKWQQTSNWNVGLDFGLLHNRITGTIDVYSQRTKDILLIQSLPPSNGAGSTIINLGKSKGHGVEISLTSVNVKTKWGLTWSTDVNFYLNREQIVELNSPSLKADIGNGWFVGQPFSVIYDYKKIGIWQDAAAAAVYGQKVGQIRVEDVNGDNKIDASDRQIVGNFQPKWQGGMTNRVAYKNFDFSFVVFARIGQTAVVPYLTSDGGANGYDFFNNGRINSLKRSYWTAANPTNDFPRPDASQDGMLYGSTLGYRDGSFIKCRSMNLGYTVSPKILSRAKISSLRVYVTAENPFIIYSPLVRSGLVLDPEGNGYGGTVTSSGGVNPVAPSTGGGTSRAITVGLGTPPTRQFIFGLNLKF
jgi:TonB-linked SusC/RagA family outer membrane protein